MPTPPKVELPNPHEPRPVVAGRRPTWTSEPPERDYPGGGIPNRTPLPPRGEYPGSGMPGEPLARPEPPPRRPLRRV